VEAKQHTQSITPEVSSQQIEKYARGQVRMEEKGMCFFSVQESQQR
jgi:hypothetical protein